MVRLRSQNGLGLKWLVWCPKAISSSFPPGTPYPSCLQYLSIVNNIYCDCTCMDQENDHSGEFFWIHCNPYETNKDQDFIFQLASAHLQSVRTQKHVWAPLASVSVQILSCWIVLLNIVLLNTSSCALMHSEAKLKCFSLKQRKVYCEENGAACAQKAQTTEWFSGKSFYRKILEDGLQRCVTFWYSNRVVLQEFQWSTLLFQPVWGPHACAQPSVSILDLLGGLSACRRTQKMSIR